MPNQLQLINSPERGHHTGYSQGMKRTARTLLFIFGQVAWD